MTRHISLRKGLGALGLTGVLIAAVAPTALATTSPPDGGDMAAVDMDALVAAANEEGQVNLIALPPTWANYAGVIAAFNEKHPEIETPVQQPDASSAEELVAVETQRGTDTMPDVLDVSPAIAQQALDEGIWDTFMPSTWDEIPEALKDPDGHWVASYYGIMALGVNTTIIETVPTSFADLMNAGPGQVAINGDPREAGAAFAAVMAASLANGGSFDDIMPGIQFFADLKAAGVLSSTAVTEASVTSGETPIVLDWSYNFPGLQGTIEDAGFTYEVVFPSDVVYGAYYCQGPVVDSPNPNAARLWVEHLVSDEAALNFLEGGAIPARYAAMVEAGTITDDMLSALPPAELIEQISFPNNDQVAAAQAALVENWGPMVADA
jgi:putative spermidine/putrescine transport system substrate-binding protein